MTTVGRSKSDVAIEMSAGVSHWCPLLPLACRLLSGRNDKPFRLAGYRTALDLIVGRINTL